MENVIIFAHFKSFYRFFMYIIIYILKCDVTGIQKGFSFHFLASGSHFIVFYENSPKTPKLVRTEGLAP